MIKFFRKIRQKMLTENKFSKYLLYAIGEIVLVVIGILIALNINLKSEQQKTEAKIEVIFENILNDLASEINETDYTFQFHQQWDSLSYKVLNNKLTEKDYLNPDFNYLFLLDRDFLIFKFTQQAYSSLELNIDQVPKKYNEALKDLGILYSTNRKSIEYSNNEIIRLAAKNKDYITDNCDWYSNPELWRSEVEIDFRLNNLRYKNLIMSFNLQKANLLRHVGSYRRKAIETYNKIAILQNKPIYSESYKINAEKASLLEGTWKIVNATIPLPDVMLKSKAHLMVENGKIIRYLSYDTINKFEDIIINKQNATFNISTFNTENVLYQSYTIKKDTLVFATNRYKIILTKENKTN
jgi:hypothetical protein